MGTVFLGEDGDGRRVAIKIIRPELADDEVFRSRFRTEVTAARRVRRFCTAAVLDARLDGDPLYVVTEYVDGPTLEDVVTEHGPLEGGGLEGLAVNIATALNSIHQAGIVHRDLKPSNVLPAPTGPRVIDFGIARALDATQSQTRTGQFIGTPAYIAPELMRGGQVTPAVDVFSWGCVMAFAGTGRSPFAGATLHETLNRVANQEPVLDGLDPTLLNLVSRALIKDPAQRPSSTDLLDELTRRSEGNGAPGERQPVEIRPSDPTSPVTARLTVVDPTQAKAGRRRGRLSLPRGRRLLVSAAAVLAVAAVTAAVVWSSGPGGPRPPATQKVLLPTVRFDQEFAGYGSQVENGALALDSGILFNYWWPKEWGPGMDPGFPSFMVDVKMKFKDGSAGSEAGVWCKGLHDKYFLGLYKTGIARISRNRNYQIEELARSPHPVTSGSGFSHLQAACREQDGGVRLSLWVDGSLVADVVDKHDPLTARSMGLYASANDNDRGTALFRDLSASAL
jgi:Protein kinase domain